jgi:YD repeat-containing protein
MKRSARSRPSAAVMLLLVLFASSLSQTAVAQTSITNSFFYDRNDRLIGMQSSRGISIAYEYDGNDNLVRQTVLSRAGETNGLPVLWQFLNGLTNGTPMDGPYGDPDGDGWDNYQEWLAGTDPNNPNSTPSLQFNPGTNIASLALPFTPSNFVVAAGNLDGLPGDEIVVGADGTLGTNNNSLFILTQTATNWSTQQVSVGPCGITSIAVGQPTNRPGVGIYVGLREPNGSGQVMEFTNNAGIWQSNVVAVSTNAAFVLGVRTNYDLLASVATNGLDGALYSLVYSNGAWSQTILSTNGSHRGLGTHGEIFAKYAEDSSLRLLDTGGIEVIGGTIEFYTDGILLPEGMIQNPGTGKWHFQTPSPMSWAAAEAYFTNYHGNLTLPASASENNWISTNFSGENWIGLYWVHTDWAYPYYANGTPVPYYEINTYTGYAVFTGNYSD